MGADDMDAEQNGESAGRASVTEVSSTRVRTGIAGLDTILGGGLLPRQLYVVEGHPGAGKTTLALQFLLAGCEQNEPCLLVTTNETRADLHDIAQSHGWSLRGIDILDLSAAAQIATPEQRQTLFLSSQVELQEMARAILAQLDRTRPARVVLDSLSTLRYLAAEQLAYRRQVLSLKRALIDCGCTVLVTDELLMQQDLHLRTLAHGVIQLHRERASYGPDHRHLEILKMRGMSFHSGNHDYLLGAGGLQVFPRLVMAYRGIDYAAEVLSTGVDELDILLGGGIDRGTATLLMGTSGTGKSSVTMQCVAAAVQRGHAAAVYLFDEQLHLWLHRADNLGLPLRRYADAGHIHVKQIDPAEMTPGQFTHEVQQIVHQHGVQLLVIDSLTGYLSAMPDQRFLSLHMHELLAWLSQQGTTTLLVLSQHGLLEPVLTTPIDLSYLTDTILLFRYFEHQGTIRRALSVVKRRGGTHERTIREMTMGPHGVSVGEPLTQFQGVLTGVPTYLGGDTRGQP